MTQAKRDINYFVKVEKAIKEKYGDKVIEDVRSGWNSEKEEGYREQEKKIFDKEDQNNKNNKVELNGFLVDKKLITVDRECPICGIYSFKIRDDVYFNKFGCCFECYVQHVEDREDKWEEKRRKLLNENR